MSELLKAKVNAIIEGLQAILQRIQEIERAYYEAPREAQAEIEAIPRIDLEELEKLPWTRWKKDGKGNRIPADVGEPGWIKNPAYFTGLEAPQVQFELAKALKKAGGRVELGQYVFTFSGKEQQFITRRPLKQRMKQTGSSSTSGQNHI